MKDGVEITTKKVYSSVFEDKIFEDKILEERTYHNGILVFMIAYSNGRTHRTISYCNGILESHLDIYYPAGIMSRKQIQILSILL